VNSIFNVTFLVASLGACGDDDRRPFDAGTTGTDAGGHDAGGVDAGAPDAGMACDPVAPACIDQQIGALDLFAAPTDGVVTEEGTTAGEFTTLVDATGGGFEPTESYLYARFTPTGLVKVDIGDEAAFDSTEWDIAFRRFVVRINSGVAGPSCVLAGRTAPGTTFESLTAVPEGLAYRTEEYFTASCDLVPDGSGLGSPGTALASFWTYEGCVEMTGNVYVVQLRNGAHVKLQILSYYEPAAQETCNTTHMVPMPNGAGNVRIRWAFLP
jgi:hypothetical protein